MSNKEQNKSQLEEKKKPNYVFPNFLGDFMSKVDMRTQFEASMLSMSFMMIGLIITLIYVFIYIDFKLWYKIFLCINGIAGIAFMSSYIITTFQQYRSYMEVLDFQKKLKEKDIIENKNEN